MIYQLKGVEHRYGNQTVLQIDDLTLEEGSITGLVGPNGSGKSTLLRLLAFVEKPSRGQLMFFGRRIDRLSRAERLSVTLLDQEPYLLKRSVFKNVAYGLKARGIRTDCRKEVHEALAWVGLPPSEFAPRTWRRLSGGEAQRVALAARLVLKPKVLLLDEPTANVDAASAETIKQAALRARRDWDATLVVASHDWTWLSEVCDEVLNLFNGKPIAHGIGNFLFGPWENNGVCWTKPLGDRQRLSVPPPPLDNAVGVLDPADISLHTEEPVVDAGKNKLRGILSSLAAQGRTGELFAKVLVDGLSFSAKLSEKRAREIALFPGSEVWITFPSLAVRWL